MPHTGPVLIELKRMLGQGVEVYHCQPHHTTWRSQEFLIHAISGLSGSGHPPELIIRSLCSSVQFQNLVENEWNDENSPLPHRDIMALINLEILEAVRTGLVNSPRWYM